MKRVFPPASVVAVITVVSLVAAACRQSVPPVHYGFVATLGRDTVSVERVTRTADTLVSDEVDRFPRVRQRHTRLVLAPDGTIRHLEMDITTPSEPQNQRMRHVTADVTHDSVHIMKRDSSGTRNIAFATGGGLAMPHLPQMYSLTDLYFGAAWKRADSVHLAAGDSVRMRQYYIDREFDRFPLHEGFVHPITPTKAELWHDWLSGIADATFDSAHHMLTYDGARSTYKVKVVRLGEDAKPDIAGIAQRFAAAESATGGAKQLSVRDTLRASIGSAQFMVDYGRPLARGRTLLGDVIPFDYVWRTGANAATQFSTSAPITLAGLQVPAGMYTLWTLPHPDGSVELVVNRQVGQWGTEYGPAHDLGRAKMAATSSQPTVEKFTISIVPSDAKRGELVIAWGPFKWTAPIVVH